MCVFAHLRNLTAPMGLNEPVAFIVVLAIIFFVRRMAACLIPSLLFAASSGPETEYVYDERGLKVRRDSLPRNTKPLQPEREKAPSTCLQGLYL